MVLLIIVPAAVTLAVLYIVLLCVTAAATAMRTRDTIKEGREITEGVMTHATGDMPGGKEQRGGW